MAHIKKYMFFLKKNIKPEPEFVENIFQSSVISIYLYV